MKTYRPPKNTLFLWQIRVLLALLLFILLVSGLWFVSAYFIPIVFVASLISAFFLFYYLPKYIETYLITFSDNAVILKNGVFVRRERIMPYPRLIYTERRQTFFAKLFGVSGLVFHATKVATATIELSNRDISSILEEIS